MNELYRLKPTTVVEPLIGKWWAWSHLVAPAPASLHLARYQLPALESYLDDPESHVRACRDPELIGGAFVDVPPERAGEVRDLYQETQRLRAAELRLAAELPVFSEQLASIANGESMKPFYGSVPESLQGCVELVYDYLHRSSCRIIEKLLYYRYHSPALQSLRLFTKQSHTPRPFFMSSPRLISAGDLEWKIPFASAQVDELFATDLNPVPLGRLRDLLNVEEAQINALLDLLEKRDKLSGENWSGEEIRVRHFGHACMLIEWNGTSILTDPIVETNPGSQSYDLDELPPRIDFALVTHNHQDHMSLETMLRLRSRIGTVVVPRAMGMLYGDLSLKTMLQTLGFERVIEMETLDSIAITDGEIIAVPFLGEHCDLAHGKTGYVVRAGKHSMWFAADSDCIDARMYEHLRKALGRIDTLFVGCESVGAPLSWSCGPFFPHKPTADQEKTRRYHGCDASAALELAEAVGARRIFNYAMGLEPWMEFILGLCMTPASPQWQQSEELLCTARARGLQAERPFGRWEKLFSPAGIDMLVGWSSASVSQEKNVVELEECSEVADVPPGVQALARTVAATLGCSLASVYLAALCISESSSSDNEFRVALRSKDGASSAITTIDISGNPTFRSFIERVEMAIVLAPGDGGSVQPRCSFCFEGHVANRAAGSRNIASARAYFVANDGTRAGAAILQNGGRQQSMTFLKRYLSILESGVHCLDKKLLTLMEQETITEGEAEFAF